MRWREWEDNPECRYEAANSRLIGRGIVGFAVLTALVYLGRWGWAMAAVDPPALRGMATDVMAFSLLVIYTVPPLLLAVSLTQDRDRGTGEMFLLTACPASRWIVGKVAAHIPRFFVLFVVLVVASFLEGSLLLLQGTGGTPGEPGAQIATILLLPWAAPILYMVGVSAALESVWQWRTLPAIVGMTYVRLLVVGCAALFMIVGLAAIGTGLGSVWFRPGVVLLSLVVGVPLALRHFRRSLEKVDAHLEESLNREPEEFSLVSRPGDEADGESSPALPGCLLLLLIAYCYHPISRKCEVVPVLTALAAMFVYLDARASGFRKRIGARSLFRMSASEWSFVAFLLPFVGLALYALLRNELRTRRAPATYLAVAVVISALALTCSAISISLGRGYAAPLLG